MMKEQHIYKVIQLGSRREVVVGTLIAPTEEEAIYEAVQQYGNDGEFSESDFKVIEVQERA